MAELLVPPMSVPDSYGGGLDLPAAQVHGKGSGELGDRGHFATALLLGENPPSSKSWGPTGAADRQLCLMLLKV
jgi:hypothetical protein